MFMAGKNKKAQAALEFLMTYGWAILAVLLAIGGLAYFGVLRTDTFFPDRCSLPPGLACLDYRVESFRAVLVLQNTVGDAITINNVKVSANNQECSGNESIALNNNEKAVITITECNNGEAGQKFDGTINVTYTIEQKLAHTITGTLRTKIAEGQSVSSQNVCQNAQSNDLCDGLNIVYGIGYKDACCSEYSLCCQ